MLMGNSEKVSELVTRLDFIRNEILKYEAKSDLETKAKSIIDEQIKTGIADLFIISETLSELEAAENEEDLREVVSVMDDSTFNQGEYN